MLPKYCYIDTNIFGILVRKMDLLPKLIRFLEENGYLLVLSEIQAAELSDYIDFKEKEIVEILKQLPVVVAKSSFYIFQEELESYPIIRKKPLAHPEYSEYPKFLFYLLMKNEKMKRARVLQKEDAKKLPSIVYERMSNFPIDEKSPLETQADLFAHHITIQYLCKNHPEFVLKNQDHFIDVSIFKSNQIQGYVNFYRYYIDKRIPNSHDHGDAFHLCYLPYCSYAIIEQELCSIINRIQRNNKKFTEVTVVENRWLEKKLSKFYS